MKHEERRRREGKERKGREEKIEQQGEENKKQLSMRVEVVYLIRLVYRAVVAAFVVAVGKPVVVCEIL